MTYNERGYLLGTFTILAVLAVCAWLSYRASLPDVSCWKDPHPKWALDFDFHTGIDGSPNRCGYLPPGPGSVLIRVLGEQGRNEISDFMCYPLVRTECPK